MKNLLFCPFCNLECKISQPSNYSIQITCQNIRCSLFTKAHNYEERFNYLIFPNSFDIKLIFIIDNTYYNVRNYNNKITIKNIFKENILYDEIYIIENVHSIYEQKNLNMAYAAHLDLLKHVISLSIFI